MRKLALAAIILLTGCIHHPPPRPDHLPARRWVIGVPEAGAETSGKVYLRPPSWRGLNLRDNVYSVKFSAITNTIYINPDSPYAADIATNRWPVKRSHMDLSVDGGNTWVRRIGYGVPVDPDRIEGELIWAPPPDPELMSTNAIIRMTTLDGLPFPSRSPAMPYDIPAGHYVQTTPFIIAGIHVLAPQDGAIAWASTPLPVSWRASGAGDTIKIYLLTPTMQMSEQAMTNHLIYTATNCQDMVEQTRTITMPAISAPQVRLMFVPTSDPYLRGYSATFSVE